ncbi:MAG: hypothetical protein H8D26_03165 [Methanomicrobia archaeon]|nr:hypothetical protein [Methanomicrobia archaeon]
MSKKRKMRTMIAKLQGQVIELKQSIAAIEKTVHDLVDENGRQGYWIIDINDEIKQLQAMVEDKEETEGHKLTRRGVATEKAIYALKQTISELKELQELEQ